MKSVFKAKDRMRVRFRALRPQGGKPCFYKLILFYRVFTKSQVAFYRFKKFKLNFEI